MNNKILTISENMGQNNENQDKNIKDSPQKMLKRNLSFKRLANLFARGSRLLKTKGAEALVRAIDFRLRLAFGKDVWQFRLDIPLKKELKIQRNTKFPKNILFSVVVPLYNTPQKYLKDMIDSVMAQSYENWQLVLADASDKDGGRVEKTVKSYKDERITYKKLEKNLGISGNTNAAFALSKGDYICLLDHDDVLSANALFEYAKIINEKNADMLYSDEAVLNSDMTKLIRYHFKPDFSPDYLRGVNYITHFLAFGRLLAQKAGFYENSEFDGSQDYDLILRLSEKAENIHHVPKTLYYWRSHEGSTAQNMSNKNYAVSAGNRAIAAHLDRIGLRGKVCNLSYGGAYRVKYEIKEKCKVSIIIPNKDHAEDLKKCINSVYKFGGWDNLEILIVENNSQLKRTFSEYENLKKSHPEIKVLEYKGDFNFSRINNYAAAQATGEHILLLNNDVRFISPDAIKEMVSYSQREDVGAAGAKLYYPDDTIQHGGVIVGINGSAGHSHKGLSRWQPGENKKRENTGDMFRLVTVQNYLAVTGACLMVKKQLYDRFKLDEKNFAIAYNDVDFCLRLKEAGYLNVWTPFCQGYHYESKSRGLDETSQPNPRYEKEKRHFQKKWGKYFNWGDPYYNPHFTLRYENYAYK